MTKTLIKGNEALAMAAIRGGCTHFFGYPITPQNEIPEFLARELPQAGGVFLQAESELAAINMVYGAAAAGGRPMTSSSSPGIALMQETISILSAAQLGCVIVNVQRGGPGIGSIQPSQSDYYQMTRGGGNGDYRIIALAPASAQEGAEMMVKGFELAERYRTPVFIVSDGMLGQMMEPVDFTGINPNGKTRSKGTVTGHGGIRPPITIKTLSLDPEKLERINDQLQEKFSRIAATEKRYEAYRTKDAEIIFCAYGSASRIAMNGVDILRGKNIAAGLVRVQTLWPFPDQPLKNLPPTCKQILCVEMSCGQMIDDVRLAVGERFPVAHYGRSGGVIPAPEELVREAERLLGRKKR
ncbi:MAG: 3-methyl-2-oxobutanoate dehydrogenase subunit VorB [Desulforhopalus sp.]